MGLQENIRTEPVSQLSIRKPVCVTRDTAVGESVKLMRDNNSGCVIVVDQDRKPVGIFTESNLVEILAHHASIPNEAIEKHMAQRFPWVKQSDPIADVLDAMQLKNVRMLCVVDNQDRVIGLTGQRGLMEYVAEHFPGQVLVQRIGQPLNLDEREGA